MIGFNVTTSPKQIDTKTLLLRFVVQIVVDLRYNKLYKNPQQIHNKWLHIEVLEPEHYTSPTNMVTTIDRDFEFYEFVSFLKFNEFY